ncbi:MAG TPA: hypothetical protein DDZ99_08980 [Clostridiales bacterium]|nr:hypothetical protein [Clostridiales bacterium]
MKFNRNGFVIQQTDLPAIWLYELTINYHGISAFTDSPLIRYERYTECRVVQKEAWSRDIGNGLYEELNFISNSDLLYRYIGQCKRFNIPLRLLFIESEMDAQIWSEPLPEMKFIGYEYCECPFDSQVITDFSWHEPFQKYRDKLNEYGLFSTLEDTQDFKMDYDKAFQEGIIGDGEMETYIFRVSEVSLDQFKC